MSLPVGKDACWEKLRRGILAHQPSVTIPARPGGLALLAELEERLINAPELFSVSAFRYEQTGLQLTIWPAYRFSRAETGDLLERCRRVADSLVRRAGGGGDYDRALTLHDFLTRNVVYTTGSDVRLHSMVGPLTEKKAVCEGFAKAYKYLLDRSGIPCRVVSGTGWDPVNGRQEPHAWNLVCLEGHWTHVDVTYDATVRAGDVLRYDYFALSDGEIRRDHAFRGTGLPEAPLVPGLGYYERAGLLMPDWQALEDHIRAGLRQGRRHFVAALPEDMPEAGLADRVSAAVSRALPETGRDGTFTLHCNLSRRVFHIALESV